MTTRVRARISRKRSDTRIRESAALTVQLDDHPSRDHARARRASEHERIKAERLGDVDREPDEREDDDARE